MNTNKKIAIIVGTRPEAIKMAPVIHAFQNNSSFQTIVISTGQHYEMLSQAFQDFCISPDINLNIMTHNQSLAQLSSILLNKIDEFLAKEQPDIILVQGDTNTVLVSGLCAFYRKIPCMHVEAGLRSYNIYSPFPEEFNRRVISLFAELHFTPTLLAAEALKKEGIPPQKIVVTGNTGIDALLWISKDLEKTPPLLPEALSHILDRYPRFLLVTSHRRENLGNGLHSICSALVKIAHQYPDIAIIYPVHLNPNVQNIVYPMLKGYHNIILTPPLSYRQFIYIMKKSYIILTDSGGIQEEAPALNKPVIVMRDVTERVEGIEAGCSLLAGTDSEEIFQKASDLIKNQNNIYIKMANSKNPYGDGQASHKILSAICKYIEGEK